MLGTILFPGENRVSFVPVAGPRLVLPQPHTACWSTGRLYGGSFGSCSSTTYPDGARVLCVAADDPCCETVAPVRLLLCAAGETEASSVLPSLGGTRLHSHGPIPAASEGPGEAVPHDLPVSGSIHQSPSSSVIEFSGPTECWCECECYAGVDAAFGLQWF